MTKAYKYFFPAAAAVMALAGCVNDGNEPGVTGLKECPEFTATIGGTQTRAIDRSWEEGDEIGISGCNRTNARYFTSDGTYRFTAKSNDDQIYFHDGSEAAFTAYYPWTDLSGGAVAIQADTKEQTNRKRLDFLWATAKGKLGDEKVEFTFAHKMTKVSLTVRPDDDMSYDKFTTARLSLKGISHKGSFNTTDGIATAAAPEDYSEVWEFTEFAQRNDNEKNVTFSFIFFPQILDKFEFIAELDLASEIPGDHSLHLETEIDFTEANRGMDGDNARNEWVAGRQYNLIVTLHKSDLMLNECVINGWNDIKGNDITVD